MYDPHVLTVIPAQASIDLHWGMAMIFGALALTVFSLIKGLCK